MEHKVTTVRAGHRRLGIGRALILAAEKHLRTRGVRFLHVKTLSPRRDSAEYARSRAFYRAMGLVPLEELPMLWGERNPCLVLIKCLACG